MEAAKHMARNRLEDFQTANMVTIPPSHILPLKAKSL